MANKDLEKNTLLTVMPLISLILWLIVLVGHLTIGSEDYAGWIQYYSYYMFSLFVVIVLLFTLKYSYKAHAKNVMKGLIGALTVSLIYVNADNIFTHIVYAAEYGEYYGSMYTVSSICDGVIFVCMVLFTINHFMIQANHHSSPKKVEANAVLNTIVIFAAIAGFVTGEISTLGHYDIAGIILSLANNFLYYGIFISVFSCIVRIETRLDYFRIKREEIKEKTAEEK